MSRYVSGRELEKVYKGSAEASLDDIHSAIDDYFGESSVNIVATHNGYAYVFNEDGCPLKVTFEASGDSVSVASAEPTDSIEVIEDSEVQRHVSKGLKSIVENMVNGRVTRTQVREVATLLKKDDDYWMSGILDKTMGVMGESEWSNMYEANTEKIRTSLYGSIKEIEEKVPTVKYETLDNIGEFAEELELSLGQLKKLVLDIFDESENIAFNDDDEFLCNVSASLKVEAQKIGAMLGKAERLLGEENISQVATLHDMVSNRVKTMAIVSQYLKSKARKNRS